MTPSGMTVPPNRPSPLSSRAPTNQPSRMSSAAQARELLEPTLRLLHAELEHRQPEDATGVHAMAWDALLPPGKLFRPAICVEAAMAVGMPRADAVSAALAVEYLHVATLVQDDVIDGDLLRRGRPTVAARYGTANAIVAGDALIMRTFEAIAECAGGTVPDGRLLAVVRTLATAGIEVCRGQVMEAEIQADLGCGLDRYLTMISLKTGALLRGACLSGVLLAGGSDGEQAAATQYAKSLGLAYQMTDDLLPHLSDTATSGKPALSDLANNRPTFPLLLCWQVASPADRKQLDDAVRGVQPPEEALETVRGLLAATGALERAKNEAHSQAAQAKVALQGLPAGSSRDALAAVVDLSVDRTR